MKFISKHRGYDITQDESGTFYAMSRKFNSAWSAKVYIDETLSP